MKQNHRQQLQQLSKLPYFTTASLASLLGVSNATARVTASRWEKQDRIIRLKRGYYLTRDFYLTHHNQEKFYNLVSNIIKPESYLSLEYILQQHGVLTEGTFTVTAATSKNTTSINNKIGVFNYYHIKPELYAGFRSQQKLGISYYWASKAKALFDFLYLKSLPLAKRKKEYNLAEDLRLNLDDFTQEEIAEFKSYIELAQSDKMDFIFNNFHNFLWQ